MKTLLFLIFLSSFAFADNSTCPQENCNLFTIFPASMLNKGKVYTTPNKLANSTYCLNLANASCCSYEIVSALNLEYFEYFAKFDETCNGNFNATFGEIIKDSANLFYGYSYYQNFSVNFDLALASPSVSEQKKQEIKDYKDFFTAVGPFLPGYNKSINTLLTNKLKFDNFVLNSFGEYLCFSCDPFCKNYDVTALADGSYGPGTVFSNWFDYYLHSYVNSSNQVMATYKFIVIEMLKIRSIKCAGVAENATVCNQTCITKNTVCSTELQSYLNGLFDQGNFVENTPFCGLIVAPQGNCETSNARRFLQKREENEIFEEVPFGDKMRSFIEEMKKIKI